MILIIQELEKRIQYSNSPCITHNSRLAPKSPPAFFLRKWPPKCAFRPSGGHFSVKVPVPYNSGPHFLYKNTAT